MSDSEHLHAISDSLICLVEAAKLQQTKINLQTTLLDKYNSHFDKISTALSLLVDKVGDQSHNTNKLVHHTGQITEDFTECVDKVDSIDSQLKGIAKVQIEQTCAIDKLNQSFGVYIENLGKITQGVSKCADSISTICNAYTESNQRLDRIEKKLDALQPLPQGQ